MHALRTLFFLSSLCAGLQARSIAVCEPQDWAIQRGGYTISASRDAQLKTGCNNFDAQVTLSKKKVAQLKHVIRLDEGSYFLRGDTLFWLTAAGDSFHLQLMRTDLKKSETQVLFEGTIDAFSISNSGNAIALLGLEGIQILHYPDLKNQETIKNDGGLFTLGEWSADEKSFWFTKSVRAGRKTALSIGKHSNKITAFMDLPKDGYITNIVFNPRADQAAFLESLAGPVCEKDCKDKAYDLGPDAGHLILNDVYVADFKPKQIVRIDRVEGRPQYFSELAWTQAGELQYWLRGKPEENRKLNPAELAKKLSAWDWPKK